MGIFDSFFGPSWADRVAVYMQERRLPVHERLRLCVKNLTPTAGPGELAQGLPVTEIKKYLTMLDDCDEMLNLATAMHTRKSLRIPVVAMKKKTESKWEMIMITDKYRLPIDDEVNYRKFENERFIIWNPVDAYGEDLAPCPR